MVKCEVCCVSDHKYKCPKCLIRYCSLHCYKQHQESICTEKFQASSSVEIKKADDKECTGIDSLDQLVSEDTVPVEKLEMLRHDEKLLISLQNPHLRQIMTDINSSNDSAAVLRKAMREPLFTEFADHCLRIVENKK